MTLIYLGIANRMGSFLKILAFQGFLLFGIGLTELKEVNTGNLIFILVETLVFKAVAVPLFLNYIIRRNRITREVEPYTPYFVSLITITLIIIVTFLLSNMIEDPRLNKIYFLAAISALFTGLYIIITRRKIITHIMGFLVIENGVFILSIAVGNEMTMLVNTGILLDLFVSVLVLGIFVNKIGDVLKDIDVEQLQKLKD